MPARTRSILKPILSLLIGVVMNLTAINIVATTPHEAVTDFMDGLKTGDEQEMEKYLDNQYVNLLVNATGDEAVIDRMYDALFRNFSYEIVETGEKNDVAVAKVLVRSNDFSGVMEAYNQVSYDYVVSNLYTDEIADKEALSAQCLELYVQQIEAAAEGEATLETTVFVPMIDDRYHGWNIVISDEMMRSILGNLQMPAF
ncbi:MAG: DUF4878 domain-containing protein [Bacillota bacterium]|nr:DUF4878 domain-containing protein [Bacillota bacterium]